MMDGYSFCGLSEQLATQDEIRRDPVCRWWVENGLTRITRDDIRALVKQVKSTWATVANVEGVEARSADAADLLIRIANIDGRAGVLADCMLPGPPVQLMRLDDAEMWTVHLGNDVSQSLIDLYRVLLHEDGHFWGLGHDRRGAKSLMAPTYSRDIWTPQAWDIQGMQSLYGNPRPKPPKLRGS